MRSDEHAARHGAVDAHLDQWEEQSADTLRNAFKMFLDQESIPDEWRALFEDAIAPRHATGFFFALIEFIGAVFVAASALGAIPTRHLLNSAWTADPAMPISPADAADAVIRGVLPFQNGLNESLKSGIGNDGFTTMVAITGEPPGPVDMLRLWLRGAITTAELDHAIRYSRIRDEFIPAVHELAWTQASPADAIMAAIKEVPVPGGARAAFVRGGGLDADYDWLYQAAGDSIGIQQVLTLWKYGQATETDVNLALGRSRINPLFYPLAKKTHFHPLSAFQIVRALNAGTITPGQAETWLVQNGTPADQAHALASSHSAGGTSHAHTETETMIRQAYTDHLLGHAEALTALTNIGYHADVASLILSIADAQYALKQQGHAVDVIRANFTAHRLTRAQASGKLDALQVPPAARDRWLADWDIEISAHPKTLTAVQLADAAAKGFITDTEAEQRIIADGYTQADAQVLMKLHKAKPAF